MRFIFPVLFSFLFFSFEQTLGQTTGELLNLLTQKGTITQKEADSIRAEYNRKQQAIESRSDSFPLSIGRLLRLSGYTQIGYQNFQSPSNTNGFSIRRARLDFQGDFSTKWGYRILVDFVGGSGGTAPTGGPLFSPNCWTRIFHIKRQISENYCRTVSASHLTGESYSGQGFGDHRSFPGG